MLLPPHANPSQTTASTTARQAGRTSILSMFDGRRLRQVSRAGGTKAATDEILPAISHPSVEPERMAQERAVVSDP